MSAPPSSSSQEKSEANKQTFSEWIDSILLPSNLQKALKDPYAFQAQQPLVTNWLDALLLPPHKPLQTKSVPNDSKMDNNTPSPTSDPFCNIPELIKVNFCCAETACTTKGADDQSHSTISDENLPDELQKQGTQPDAAATKPATKSSAFHSWQKFWNCGNTVVDGLPPTIDIATPIKNESSLVTAEDKSRRTDDGDNTNVKEDKEELAGAAIIDQCEDEELEEEAEAEGTVVNETIVIYYTDSGSSTDGKPRTDMDATAEQPVHTATVQTVVRVALDPWTQDDAILQERARNDDAYKSPCASVSNGESTGAMATSPTSPIRFQNLATGSFCEIASDAEPAASDEPTTVATEAGGEEESPEAVEEATSKTMTPTEELKPLVEEEEEEEEADRGEEKKEEKDEKPEEEEARVDEQVAVGVVAEEEPAAAEEQEETREDETMQKEHEKGEADSEPQDENQCDNEEEAEDEPDLKVVAVVDVQPEKEPGEGEDTNESREEVGHSEKNAEGTPALADSLLDETSPCSSGQGESEDAEEPDMGVEGSGTTVKLVSLFVGVFDSPQAPELH